MTFPDGDMIKGDSLAVVISLCSDVPVNFNAPLVFYDPLGAKCVPPAYIPSA